ncbi:DUF3298 domain-containing protein [Candidatus Omnitrophota bacterium]
MKVLFSIILFFVIFSLANAAVDFSYETVVFEKVGSSYVVDVKYPKITDTRLPPETRQKANDEIEKFVHSIFDSDLETFIANEPMWEKEGLEKIAGRDSDFIEFEVVYLDTDRISIYFDKYSYGIGAAHGLTHLYGFNYDLKNLKTIKLEDIFEPEADYLKQISDYCFADLDKRLDPPWFSEGVVPDTENFKDFAISKDSLIIYFSDYQVACYAAGTQKVEIPFQSLSGLSRALALGN